MRSRCGAYQRQMRSSSAGQPVVLPCTSATASTNDGQCAAAAAGTMNAAMTSIGSAPVMTRSRRRPAVAGPTPGSNWATRKPAARSRRFSAQCRKARNILDMRGFEEFETAEFDERDIAARELEFERSAMVRCAKEYRLCLECDAGLALLQDFSGDIAGLIDFVAHVHQSRALGGSAVRPQVLREAFLCLLDHSIRGRKDRLCRAIVAVQCDDCGARGEMARKIEDVAHRRRAERV